MTDEDSSRFQKAIEQLFALSRDAERRHTDLMTHCAEEYRALSVSVARIEEQLTAAAKTACPNPGLCLALENKVEGHATQIADIQLSIAQAKGGWRGILTVAGALGGAAGMAAAIAAWVRKP